LVVAEVHGADHAVPAGLWRALATEPADLPFFENGRRQAVIVRIYSGGDADLPADQETASCKAPAWHIKLETTVRYFGIEVDDGPEFAEQTEV
jgi:hypothetical protein